MTLDSVGIITATGVNVIMLLLGLWRLHKVATRVERAFDYFSLEHELLMTDYAERKGIKLEGVQTRLKTASWWR